MLDTTKVWRRHDSSSQVYTQNGQLPIGLMTQFYRTLHWYRSGYGFDSRWCLNFFQALIPQLLKLGIQLRWSIVPSQGRIQKIQKEGAESVTLIFVGVFRKTKFKTFVPRTNEFLSFELFGTKRIGRWAGADRGCVRHHWALGKGWVTQFLAIYGGESSCFITGIGTHLTQLTTEVTLSSSK